MFANRRFLGATKVENVQGAAGMNRAFELLQGGMSWLRAIFAEQIRNCCASNAIAFRSTRRKRRRRDSARHSFPFAFRIFRPLYSTYVYTPVPLTVGFEASFRFIRHFFQPLALRALQNSADNQGKDQNVFVFCGSFT